MNNLRWVNQSQAQTLYSACFLAYFRAVWLLLFQANVYGLLLSDVLDPIGLGRFGFDIAPVALMFALAIGALGVANEKKWGYYLLAGAAIYAVVSVLWVMQRLSAYGDIEFLIRLMFDSVLVVLVLHPMSREYRKIWFR